MVHFWCLNTFTILTKYKLVSNPTDIKSIYYYYDTIVVECKGSIETVEGLDYNNLKSNIVETNQDASLENLFLYQKNDKTREKCLVFYNDDASKIDLRQLK